MADLADDRAMAEDEARQLLARAADLDAAHGSESSRVRLREAAIEAGIGAEAFDAAWRELRNDATSLTVAGDTRSIAPNGAAPHASAEAAPWWVKLSLWGVPDRKAAMGYYWLFTSAGIISGAVSISTRAPIAIGLAGLSLFGIWTTSQAVRWLDKHGWTLR